MTLLNVLGYVPTLYVSDGHGAGSKPTAGKRTPVLPDGSVILENHFNRPTAQAFGAAAEALGFRVVYVSPELTDTPLTTRTKRANDDYAAQRNIYPNAHQDKIGLYVSFHYNALNGVFDNKAGGVETLHFPGSEAGIALASAIQRNLLQGTNQADRKIKPRGDLHELKATHMVAVLIEAGFMDKLDEARLMTSTVFQQETALDALRGVCEYYGISAQVNPPAPAIPSPYSDWEAQGLDWLQSQLGVASTWKPNETITIGAFGLILSRYHEKIKAGEL